MEITREDLGNRQVRLTIQVDEKRVDKTLRGVARRISKQYNIPGFRRGRAPFRVVLQRFGRETLLQEALDDLGQEIFKEALEGENLEPYAPAELENVELDPLVFTIIVPLKPSVDLADYRGLRIDPQEIVISDEQIEQELERLRQDNALLEDVEDRPAQMDDQVTLHFTGEADGTRFIQRSSHNLVLRADAPFPAPGFADQIVGMNLKETNIFGLVYPKEYPQNQDLAGKEVQFNVELEAIYARTLPDIDDDLARTIGDFDTLDELREDIRRQFHEHEQRQADSAYADEAIDALVDEAAALDYPPVMVEERLDNMLDDLEERMEANDLDLKDQLKLTGQTDEQLREGWRSQAENMVCRSLALQELIRLENISIDGEELDEHISTLSQRWGEQAADMHQALSQPEQLRTLSSNMLADKAIQRLIDIAKGQAPPLEEETSEDAELDEQPGESTETSE